ncbi:MAG: sigma-E processing peptidase SpoIIGA [Lachnospiraceae bacterium]|nr:sigma-E processing peptidase SpoIIGA [Lachnospiraceae bacterium]
MDYEFYIDQFFVEQLISGYLLLLAAGILCGITPDRRRLLSGAVINAGFAVGFVIFGSPLILLSGFIVSAAVSFWKWGFRKEWRYNRDITAGLLAATICFGGMLSALTAILPLPVFALLVPALELLRLLARMLRQRMRQEETAAIVTLSLNGKSLKLKGLLDTGNQLREPLTASPASIVQRKSLEPLLDGDWAEQKGFFLIPYHSLGTEEGWMQGTCIDEMHVATQRGCKTVKKPLIALYDKNVSSRREYQIILHPEHAP